MLAGGVNGKPPQPTVGRVANTNQGSISVGLAMEGITAQSVWYKQTPYGSEYWEATKKYRVEYLIQSALTPPDTQTLLQKIGA